MLATSLLHPDWGLLRDQFWALTVGGLTAGSIYALVALGYTMVYGVLRLINFANSEIFMLGTFGALFATKWMGIEPGGDSVQTGITLVAVMLVCLAAAMVFSGASAVVLERVAYRPLRKRGATRLAALDLGHRCVVRDLRVRGVPAEDATSRRSPGWPTATCCSPSSALTSAPTRCS